MACGELVAAGVVGVLAERERSQVLRWRRYQVVRVGLRHLVACLLIQVAERTLWRTDFVVVEALA